MNPPPPAPNLPAANPTCPRCGSNARVVPLEAPHARPGQPLLDEASAWPWECCGCVMVFTGTEQEWVRMSNDRHTLRESLKPRHVPEGVKP